jgi:hypothetical protein
MFTQSARVRLEGSLLAHPCFPTLGPHQIALFKRQSVTPEATMVRVVPIEVTMMVVPIVAVRMIVAIVMMVVRTMIIAVPVPRCGWNRAANRDCADNAQCRSDFRQAHDAFLHLVFSSFDNTFATLNAA